MTKHDPAVDAVVDEAALAWMQTGKGPQVPGLVGAAVVKAALAEAGAVIPPPGDGPLVRCTRKVLGMHLARSLTALGFTESDARRVAGEQLLYLSNELGLGDDNG